MTITKFNSMKKYMLAVYFTIGNITIPPILIACFLGQGPALQYLIVVGIGIPYLYNSLRSLEYYGKLEPAKIQLDNFRERVEKFKPSKVVYDLESKRLSRQTLLVQNISAKKEMYDRMTMLLRSGTIFFGIILFLGYSLKKYNNSIDKDKFQSEIQYLRNDIDSLKKQIEYHHIDENFKAIFEVYNEIYDKLNEHLNKD